MAEALLNYFRSTLPEELAVSLKEHLEFLDRGDFHAIFQHPLVQVLLGHKEDEDTKDIRLEDFPVWNDYVFRRLGALLSTRRDGGLDVGVKNIFLSFLEALQQCAGAPADTIKSLHAMGNAPKIHPHRLNGLLRLDHSLMLIS